MLRPITSVEIMMPGYSRDSFSRCIQEFPRSLSGWGLDILSGYIVREKMGLLPHVIDSVQATHSKPVDTNNSLYYHFLLDHGINPQTELDDICTFFSLKPEISSI